MNHESAGYPLPLSQANKLRAFSPPHSNATHMPTSWQGISTPRMPPRKRERRVSWNHSRRREDHLATAESPGIPPGRDEEPQTPVTGIWTQTTNPRTERSLFQRLPLWYLTLATSSGQDSSSSWQNLCHETPATKALRQPVYLPSANH